jgi:hypothetical protein
MFYGKATNNNPKIVRISRSGFRDISEKQIDS